MVSLRLPGSTIDMIIDNPTVIHPLLSPSPPSGTLSGISSDTAQSILVGYTHGFRAVFILNASLAALCVFVAYVMIKHKELIRADEAEMRRRALESLQEKERTSRSGHDMRAEMKDLGNGKE